MSNFTGNVCRFCNVYVPLDFQLQHEQEAQHKKQVNDAAEAQLREEQQHNFHRRVTEQKRGSRR